MPERKLPEPQPRSDLWVLPHREDCLHPEHWPAQHVVRSPGRYRHECPRCGHVVIFRVPLPPYDASL